MFIKCQKIKRKNRNLSLKGRKLKNIFLKLQKNY